jgi:ethanolamine utilization protein EutA (predicted chaperonin)
MKREIEVLNCAESKLKHLINESALIINDGASRGGEEGLQKLERGLEEFAIATIKMQALQNVKNQLIKTEEKNED